MSAADWRSFAVIPTAHRRVLLSAWQANRNPRSLWFLALACLPVASVPVSMWWYTHTLPVTVSFPVTAIVFMAMPFASIVLVAAWAMLLFNVLLQNHPHTARLLPAQVPVLRNTLCATAALLCGIATLLSWIADGPVLAIAAGMALGLAWLALILRWGWLWVVIGITPVWALPSLGARSDLDGAAWLWRTAPEVLTLIALVLSALAVRAVVMTGGARHERDHARLQEASAALRGQMQGYKSQSSVISRWVRALLWGEIAYAAWMAHVLRLPRQSVGRRLALGLGPRAHWSSLLAMQSIVLLVVPLLAVYTNYRGTGQAMGNGALIAITMIGLIGMTRQLPVALWASRREQALLCLLPGAPGGTKLNRWLARLLVATAAGPLALLALVLLVLGPVAHTDAFGGKNGDMALSLLVLDAPWVFLLLRDWARAPAPVGRAPGLLLLAMFSAFGMAFAWVYWMHCTWFELAALTLLLTLPLAWWRWRVISRAPTAWPVGRLG
jgi:hypothetical protein